MASIAMMVGGAVVNALAFTGSSYAFRLLDGRGVDEERQRHDKAIEQLQRARDEWAQTRTERLDFINEELRRQGHAVRTFREVDDAMQEYAAVTGKNLPSPPALLLRRYSTWLIRYLICASGTNASPCGSRAKYCKAQRVCGR